MPIENTRQLLKVVFAVALALNSVLACAAKEEFVLNSNSIIEVRLNDYVVSEKINKYLTVYFEEFYCPNGKAPYVIIERQYVNEKYASLSYSVAGECESNASPFAFSGGITFLKTTGSLIRYSDLELDAELVKQEINRVYRNFKKEACSEPEHYGEFYVTQKGIVLKEFYPMDLDIACEFEVMLPH